MSKRAFAEAAPVTTESPTLLALNQLLRRPHWRVAATCAVFIPLLSLFWLLHFDAQVAPIGVDSLQRRNLRPVVVLLMSQSFGSRASNEDLAKSLSERKVPVCRVYCDADLSQTLSSFAANTFSQEVSWRRPVLSHLT